MSDNLGKVTRLHPSPLTDWTRSNERRSELGQLDLAPRRRKTDRRRDGDFWFAIVLIASAGIGYVVVAAAVGWL